MFHSRGCDGGAHCHKTSSTHKLWKSIHSGIETFWWLFSAWKLLSCKSPICLWTQLFVPSRKVHCKKPLQADDVTRVKCRKGHIRVCMYIYTCIQFLVKYFAFNYSYNKILPEQFYKEYLHWCPILTLFHKILILAITYITDINRSKYTVCDCGITKVCLICVVMCINVLLVVSDKQPILFASSRHWNHSAETCRCRLWLWLNAVWWHHQTYQHRKSIIVIYDLIIQKKMHDIFYTNTNIFQY